MALFPSEHENERSTWHHVALQQAECLNRLSRLLMISAETLTALFDLVDKLLKAEAGDQIALATAQASLAAITAQDAALVDPALQARFEATLANLAAATAAPTPVEAPPVGEPTTP